MYALRAKHPSIPILIQEYDVDSAFKRLFLNFKSAIKTIITLSNIVYISLRSTFGRTSSYYKFGVLAEPIANIMNKALYSNRLQALYQSSPYSEYYEEPEILHSNIPFKPAHPFLFDILLYNDRTVDLYVDDYISICLDKVN